MTSYTSSGAPITLNTQTNGDQLRQSVTKLSDGSLVAVWETSNSAQDGSGSAIVMRRLDATGAPIGAEMVVNTQTANSQIKPQVAALASGGYVVTWETADAAQDGNGTAIKAQIFDASGLAVGSEFRVNTQTVLNQQQPTVTGLADGSFVVAWHTTDNAQDGAGWALKGQHFSATGAAIGGEFLINTSAFGSQMNADIAGLANGGFVVTWQIGNTGTSMPYARVYDANGVPAGNEIVVSDYSSGLDTAVVAFANGGFAVAFSRGGAIFMQRFDAARAKVGGETYVGDGYLPEIATLTEGGLIVTWRGSSSQLGARTFDANGAPTSSTFVINDVSTSAESSVVALSGGGFALFSSAYANGQDVQVRLFKAVNGAPELGAATRAISVAENGTAVATLTATDDGGPSPLTYAITGGADAARFTINASTGALSFVAAPDREAPTDAGANNVYDVVVTASDGPLSDSQAIAVTVTNVNEAPVITSNGGGTSALVQVAENTAAAAAVVAADVDSAVTYAIVGGADAALFTIDAATGALSFVAASDFEAPADSDGDNVYDVIVRASDGSLVDVQTLAVAITNANEAPEVTSAAAFAASENGVAVGTVTAVDPDGTAPTYAITGGADAALFVIDPATGALSFVQAPDFEAPGDADGDNVYDVVVSIGDGEFAVAQAIAVAVGNVDEGVTISSSGGADSAAVSLLENGRRVATIVASDADGDAVTYSIAGGADAALFVIDETTGELSFASAPNFEAPGDVGADNVYDVVVRAAAGAFSDTQALAVAVGNANEGLAITSFGGGNTAALSVAENTSAVGSIAAADIDGDAVSYAIAGGADAARFAIDAQTGALRFLAAPDHEAAADAGGNNVYDVVVAASDGYFVDTQALAVTVTDLREGNVITGNSAANTISTSNAPAGQPRATELEDTIYGLGGNDTIVAAGGEDIVDGGAGSDKITGGTGADVLTGGTGADRFIYTALGDSLAGAADIITDFHHAEGDLIDLKAIDARSNLGGNQAFTFIGEAAFSGQAGQLRFAHDGADTWISGDVNGDRAADFLIQLSGLIPLSSADFVL